MAVKDAVEVYYDYYLEDCRYASFVRLFPQEDNLRGILGSSALNEKQKALVYDLLEKIRLAKAKKDAILKDCIDPEYYYNEYYDDYNLPF